MPTVSARNTSIEVGRSGADVVTQKSPIAGAVSDVMSGLSKGLMESALETKKAVHAESVALQKQQLQWAHDEELKQRREKQLDAAQNTLIKYTEELNDSYDEIRKQGLDPMVVVSDIRGKTLLDAYKAFNELDTSMLEPEARKSLWDSFKGTLDEMGSFRGLLTDKGEYGIYDYKTGTYFTNRSSESRIEEAVKLFPALYPQYLVDISGKSEQEVATINKKWEPTIRAAADIVKADEETKRKKAELEYDTATIGKELKQGELAAQKAQAPYLSDNARHDKEIKENQAKGIDPKKAIEDATFKSYAERWRPVVVNSVDRFVMAVKGGENAKEQAARFEQAMLSGMTNDLANSGLSNERISIFHKLIATGKEIIMSYDPAAIAQEKKTQLDYDLAAAEAKNKLRIENMKGALPDETLLYLTQGNNIARVAEAYSTLGIIQASGSSFFFEGSKFMSAIDNAVSADNKQILGEYYYLHNNKPTVSDTNAATVNKYHQSGADALTAIAERANGLASLIRSKNGTAYTTDTSGKQIAIQFTPISSLAEASQVVLQDPTMLPAYQTPNGAVVLGQVRTAFENVRRVNPQAYQDYTKKVGFDPINYINTINTTPTETKEKAEE